MFPRQAAEIRRKPSSVRPPADEQDVAADVVAEFDRGEPVVALLANISQSERSNLLESLCLCAPLVWKSTRVIRIGGSGGGPVDARRLCHLLVAASSAGATARDPVEHLASILTSPCADERSLTLVVENGDTLLPDALAFVARLAAASSAQPLRMRVLLLGSHALEARLAGVGPVAVKWLDGLPIPGPEPLPVRQRSQGLRLTLVAVGCLAGVVAFAAIRIGDDDRLSANVTSAFQAPPSRALSSAAFAVGAASSTAAPPPEPTPRPPATTLRQSDPLHPGGSSSTPPQVRPSSSVPPEGAAQQQANVGSEAGKAAPGHAPEPHITTASLSAGPPPKPEPEASPPTAAETLVRHDAQLAEDRALLARRPAEGTAPPGMERPASPAALLEPPPSPAQAAETASPSAAATVAVPPATEPPAVPLMHAEPLPAQPEQTEPPPAPVQPEEAVVPSTAAVDAARPAAGPSAAQIMHTEPPAAPVRPAEEAVPNTAAAAAAASAAQSTTEPHRPPSGASPTIAAALLARGDALIAIGDVAAARPVYQRAAALASARAATAAGKTYDARFLQEIGAIGVVADPDAAAAWYRRGVALGDEDAAPLLGGLDVRADR